MFFFSFKLNTRIITAAMTSAPAIYIIIIAGEITGCESNAFIYETLKKKEKRVRDVLLLKPSVLYVFCIDSLF
jgi:hypothetical protein